MDVKVISIGKLADYEQPLSVNLSVKGEIGSSTGKRLLIPGDIFEVNSKPSFPHEKREIPIYFDYPFSNQDAVRVNFPASLTVESSPTSDKFKLQDMALYNVTTASALTNVTVWRNYSMAAIMFYPKEYTALRSFYSKMETEDQEGFVLTASPITSASSTTAAN
jgi:hypothetical protein